MLVVLMLLVSGEIGLAQSALSNHYMSRGSTVLVPLTRREKHALTSSKVKGQYPTFVGMWYTGAVAVNH